MLLGDYCTDFKYIFFYFKDKNPYLKNTDMF